MNETVTRKSFLEELANGLSTLITRAMEQIFGAGVSRPVLGPLTWVDLVTALGLVLLLLVAHSLAAAFVRRKTKPADGSETKGLLWRQFFLALGGPIYSLIWVGGLYVAAATLLRKLLPAQEWEAVLQFFSKLVDLGVFAVLFWLFFRLTGVLETRLAAWAAKRASKLDQLFVPLLVKCLRVMVPVMGVILALPVLGLPAQYAGLVAKGTSILLIVAVALISFQAIGLGEKVVLMKFDIAVADNLRARKIHTQLQVISKTLSIFIGIFTVASILMLFEEVRHLGTSILASAGVIGVVLGFAAQKTIANLFAGFQIALAQPIRMDDVVIVEGEWGRIEEITLTYVVVHIWDDRRLIVPLSDFIEKPFQNWTRVSAHLLGSCSFGWITRCLWRKLAKPYGKSSKQALSGTAASGICKCLTPQSALCKSGSYAPPRIPPRPGTCAAKSGKSSSFSFKSTIREACPVSGLIGLLPHWQGLRRRHSAGGGCAKRLSFASAGVPMGKYYYPLTKFRESTRLF